MRGGRRRPPQRRGGGFFGDDHTHFEAAVPRGAVAGDRYGDMSSIDA